MKKSLSYMYFITAFFYLMIQACQLDASGTNKGGTTASSSGSSSGGTGGDGASSSGSAGSTTTGGGEGGAGASTSSSSGGFGGSTTSNGGGGFGGDTTSSSGSGGFGGGGNGGSSSSSSSGGGGGAGPTCGNNTKESGETCDGSDLDNQDCGSVPGGFTSGTLDCLSDCSAFDTSACISPPPTCLAGNTNGTVDTITASGAIETGFLLHHGDGTEFYSNLVPTMYTFTGDALPGQLALFGKDGIQFDLQNGVDPVSMTFYEVADFGTLPSPQCDGLGLKTQACLSLVTKSFRCQFSPYNEAFDCPADVSFLEPVESPSDFFQDTSAGSHLLVVDLDCP
jgi:hypothetical protein